MAPFEVLYGRNCRIPICWKKARERKLLGPKLVQITMKNLRIIRANMKVAQDRQKSYANLKRADIEYNVGEKVFLKISPWKGVLRLGQHSKLKPEIYRAL